MKRRRGVEMTLDGSAVLDACAEHVRRMFPGHLVSVTRSGMGAVVAQIIKPRERKTKAIPPKETRNAT